MSRGRRYSGEGKLNYKKVFAVIIAIIVFIMAIFIIKNILTKAKNTKPVEIINYFAIYQDNKWGILGSNGEKIRKGKNAAHRVEDGLRWNISRHSLGERGTSK